MAKEMSKHGHVSFKSNLGQKYLLQSNYIKHIVQCRMKQIKGSTCGITSIGILLNAKIASSTNNNSDNDDSSQDLYSEATLISTLGKYCHNMPSMNKLLRIGITLNQLGNMIKNIGSTYVEIFHCCNTNEKMINKFRTLIKHVFTMKYGLDVGIICNFRVATLHNKDGPRWGHFSPIGGYHEETDQILLLDTKNEELWVDVDSMWNAMNTKDSCGKYRGFIFVMGVPLLKMQY